jgi:hypothetical protein
MSGRQSAATTPYLLRFASLQINEANAPTCPKPCTYDPTRDLLMVNESGSPAVLDSDCRPLATKKKDLEKGEDQKDRWM